ncbi:hypothetical protein H3146_21235, partial [Streptomyces sp. OF3]
PHPAAPAGMPAAPGAPVWGAPPPPPKSSTGKIVGIVVACVAGLALLASLSAVVLYMAADDKGDSGNGKAAKPTGKRYSLKLRDTVLDGEYKLADDVSKEVQADLDAEVGGDQYTSVSGVYAPAGDGEDSLTVLAFHGDIELPGMEKRGFLRGSAEDEGTRVVRKATDFEIPGASGTVTCQVLAEKEDGVGDIIIPTCVWADRDMLVSTVVGDPELVDADPKAVDLEAAAKDLVTIRDELRVPRK